MATFDIVAFKENPSLVQLDACRKRDLHEMASFYGICVSTALRKAELKAALVSGLVEKGIVALRVSASLPEHGVMSQPVLQVPDQAVAPSVSTPVAQGLPEDPPMTLPRFEPLSIESSVGSKQDAKLRVRLARLQLEKEEREREFQLRKELELRRVDAELARAREVELKKVEAVTAVKLRQLELQLELQQASLPATAIQQAEAPFDVGKNIRLVPVFRDTEVDSYFESFERIATALHWPRDSWAILLHCKLVGKAQEVCSSLSAEDSLDYDKLKSAILLAYELVLEAYRQRFRGLKRGQGQSYRDFARKKSVLFDRWCVSSKATDLASMRQLMLVEEFKNCVSERIAVHLSEQKVSSLQQAATLADEFALIHKTSVIKHDRRDDLVKVSDVLATQYPKGAVLVSHSKAKRKCFFCLKSGHLIANCETYKQKRSVSRARSVPANNANASMVSRSRIKLCFFCHKTGHLIAHCSKANSQQNRSAFKRVNCGSQTDKVASPWQQLEHNCSVVPFGECQRSTNYEMPPVGRLSDPDDLQCDTLCTTQPFKPAPLANQHACHHDLAKKLLKSVSVRPSSYPLSSSYVMPRKTSGCHSRHYFEGIEPTPFSVLDSSKRSWQIRQAIPNRYYGAW
uniref:CCHC-type domain-containing protein n=1 Tax=Oreochromis niloticus TaxID=8128 RepID=A0A669CSJ4_ORENI